MSPLLGFIIAAVFCFCLASAMIGLQFFSAFIAEKFRIQKRFKSAPAWVYVVLCVSLLIGVSTYISRYRLKRSLASAVNHMNLDIDVNDPRPDTIPFSPGR